jgi:hypothetical protein
LVNLIVVYLRNRIKRGLDDDKETFIYQSTVFGIFFLYSMKWIAKAIVQKIISGMPFSHEINYFFQKYITGGVFLSDEYFEDRLTHCANHYQYFQKYNPTSAFTHLEIGTGWYPIVPLGMFLYGAQRSITIDLHRLTNAQRTVLAIQKFREYYLNGKLEKFLPGIQNERIQILLKEANDYSTKDFHDLLRKFNIKYMVMDVRDILLEEKSIDLITSNNTFEHIEPSILPEILQKLKYLCKKGGVMSHFIDLSDHYAHMDKSITIYNFLKFSDSQWKWINNSVQPMNRLRIYEYEALYQKAEIPITERIDRPPDLESYRKVKVHSRFSNYPETENAVSHSLLISKM